MATLNLNSNINKDNSRQDKSQKNILKSITQLFSNKENESDKLEGNIYNNYKNLGSAKDKLNISIDPNASVSAKRVSSKQTKKVSNNNNNNSNINTNNSKNNTNLNKIDDDLDNLKTSLSNNIENIKESVEKNSKNIPAIGFDFKKVFMWIGILMLLSFFGLNIFSLFGNIIAFITNLIRPILTFFGILSINTTQKTLDVASDGTKGVVNASNNILQYTIDLLNNITQGGLSFLKDRINQQDNSNITNSDNTSKTNNNTMEHGTISTANQDDINKLSDFIDLNFDNVNKFNSNNNKNCKTNCLEKCKNDTNNNENCIKHCDKYCDEVLPIPEPTIDNSRVQSHKASGKAGFCYIGEENGIRSCVKVSQSDVCMSGKIYPSRETCINPSLRK